MQQPNNQRVGKAGLAGPPRNKGTEQALRYKCLNFSELRNAPCSVLYASSSSNPASNTSLRRGAEREPFRRARGGPLRRGS